MENYSFMPSIVCSNELTKYIKDILAPGIHKFPTFKNIKSLLTASLIKQLFISTLLVRGLVLMDFTNAKTQTCHKKNTNLPQGQINHYNYQTHCHQNHHQGFDVGCLRQLGNCVVEF